MCGCLSHGPYWGPGQQPRHVPWLGIEPATLWFAAHAQSTELHQPGRVTYLLILISLLCFAAATLLPSPPLCPHPILSSLPESKGEAKHYELSIILVYFTLAVFIKNNLLRKLQIYTKEHTFCLNDLNIFRSFTYGCIVNTWIIFTHIFCCVPKFQGYLFWPLGQTWMMCLQFISLSIYQVLSLRVQS